MPGNPDRPGRGQRTLSGTTLPTPPLLHGRPIRRRR